MGMPKLLKRALLLLLIVPFIALVFSHSIPWMAYPQLACPLDKGSSFPDLDIHRSDFPQDFVFGTATAAYQVEGAANEGGRGPSIWDTFSHTPGWHRLETFCVSYDDSYTSALDDASNFNGGRGACKTVDGGTGDVAVDQYHRYQDDVDILKSMHMDAYRFSISWSRIIPDGQGPDVNKEGIAYYNRLIDYLLSKGLKPYVTLYHWDLPQALQDSFNGWPSREIVRHFAVYAEACFSAFGDRVKNWITFNEPMQFAWNGYGVGAHAPGRTSDRSVSPVGNSSTEPYLAVHHILLAHATAVNIYRKKFQVTQRGTIGMTVDCEWGEPMTESPEDKEAAQRRVLFQLGWFLDPIFFGDYPKVMRDNAGARLPTFSVEEKSLLYRSLDFIGLNHYTSRWVTSAPPLDDPEKGDFYHDQCVTTSAERDGIVIGAQAYSFWLYVVPWGLGKLIDWTWDRYKMPMYITENGIDTKNMQVFGQPPQVGFIEDNVRTKFYQDYLAILLASIRKGADVRCYFAWSLLDNFEWALGYTSRFGLFYVDYKTLKRYPKKSSGWFTKFLEPRDENLCRSQGRG